MGDLAEAMGVQKGSLYSLTESKQELLYETMREGAAAFHAGLDAIPVLHRFIPSPGWKGHIELE